MANLGSDMLTLPGEKPGVIFEGEDHLRREKCEGQTCSNTDANTSVGRASGGLGLNPSLVHHYGISPIQSQVLVL